MGGPESLTKPIEVSHSVEAEDVTISVRFPVFAEMPSRATLYVKSATFQSSVQEYFDDPESLYAFGTMLLRAADDMRSRREVAKIKQRAKDV